MLKKQIPDIYQPKQGLGFFGYYFFNNNYWIFPMVGILRTFRR